MIFNFVDPELERIWVERIYPYLPGKPEGRRIWWALTELYDTLETLDEEGPDGVAGIEEAGEYCRVPLGYGYVRFRRWGDDISDVAFEPLPRPAPGG